MQLEASLSPPSYSGAALQPDPGLGAGPTVSAPPAEGAPVRPQMLEPCSVYDLESDTIVAVNPTPEDIAQPCADLQMETMPCAEEPWTPITSCCVAAEEAASHERRLKTFTEGVTRPIRSPLLPRPVKTKRAPPQGQLELPKRSERLANHPLASVTSSKRAEVMLMRRFNVIPEVGAPNSDSKKAYMQLYKEKLDASHFEAMRDLLPALRSSSAMGITAE